jgi:LuxR family maltose regulon positive regulatory protein
MTTLLLATLSIMTGAFVVTGVASFAAMWAWLMVDYPPLPLARLRARGQMVRLGASELAFTREEAAAFLRGVMELDLSGDEVASLERRTEGWIAALQLAALSMRDCKDVSGFVESFSGSNRHVLDFLADEVLVRQPEGVREFLLETSVLERMSASLCDALTGRDDGQEMLERLEKANLFLVPLDEEGRYYRYHHLFAAFLRERLRRARPDAIPELHRRAGLWYEEEDGCLASAIEHALAAGDHERAADLIEEETGVRRTYVDASLLLRWLGTLPDGLVRRRPHARGRVHLRRLPRADAAAQEDGPARQHRRDDARDAQGAEGRRDRR